MTAKLQNHKVLQNHKCKGSEQNHQKFFKHFWVNILKMTSGGGNIKL